MKAVISAQKALQGSKTERRELLGVTEENSVSPTRGHRFYHKKETEKNELVARPDMYYAVLLMALRVLKHV